MTKQSILIAAVVNHISSSKNISKGDSSSSSSGNWSNRGTQGLQAGINPMADGKDVQFRSIGLSVDQNPRLGSSSPSSLAVHHHPPWPGLCRRPPAMASAPAPHTEPET